MTRIRPLSSHSIGSDFVQVYREAMAEQLVTDKNTPHRVLNLRPSQMPFCPLNFFIQHAVRGLYRDLDMKGTFYTSVGTTVHEVLQNFLCRSGRLLADYYCRECDTWHRFSYVHECCEFPTAYHEVSIKWGGVQGHIDAVYQDRKGKLWVLDFKTTSIDGAEAKKKDPGVAYREQIETYAVLFELQYGLQIEGIMDAFIIRDNPEKDPVIWARPLTDALRSKVKTRLNKYKRMHRDALDAETGPEVVALLNYGRCVDPYCKVCKLSDASLRTRLKHAYRMGKANGNVPIRAMANRALSSK